MDGQSFKWRRNITENFNPLSRAHESYRQTDDRQTDGRATAYSERERLLKMVIMKMISWYVLIKINMRELNLKRPVILMRSYVSSNRQIVS